MILTAAALLDTQERIVVLVRNITSQTLNKYYRGTHARRMTIASYRREICNVYSQGQPT